MNIYWYNVEYFYIIKRKSAAYNNTDKALLDFYGNLN